MIILYKSNHCPHCRQVEDILQVCDIPYEARNVTEKPDYKRKLRKIGVRSLPVLQYGDIVITDMEFMINWIQINEISLGDKSACDQFIKDNHDELLWFFTEYRR